MTVTEIAEKLDLQALTGHENMGRTITGGCVSDLLSYVMGNAGAGNVWITIQVHPNVVGVAELLDLSCVVIAHGQAPEEATLARAREHGVPLLTSELTAFELAGRIYALGVA